MLCEVNPCICCMWPRNGHVFALAPDQLSLSQVKLLNYCAFLTQCWWWYQPGHWTHRIWDIHHMVFWRNSWYINIWSYFLCKVITGEFHQTPTEDILQWRTDENICLDKSKKSFAYVIRNMIHQMVLTRYLEVSISLGWIYIGFNGIIIHAPRKYLISANLAKFAAHYFTLEIRPKMYIYMIISTHHLVNISYTTYPMPRLIPSPILSKKSTIVGQFALGKAQLVWRQSKNMTISR